MLLYHGQGVCRVVEHAAYPWEQVFHVCRGKTASYLYITSQRAFLIPHNCVKGGGARLWELVGRRVPADRQSGTLK